MNNSDRDDLLIRMDERVGYMHASLEKVNKTVESHDDDIKNAKSSIKVLRWIWVIFLGFLTIWKLLL